jgi:hypothetical protein
MSNITARLINARRVPRGGGVALTGECYEHKSFYDGELIITSVITSEDGPIVCTKFSIYEVESWAEP